jgi:ribosomal protein S12 methylthiotransferase
MAELVQALAALGEQHGAWVRLHYVYPYPHVDEIIELMSDDPAAGGLVPYLDIPFQHASPRILKLMKRPAAPERVLERVRAWRQAKPDLAIRSTFIVGFPGETEAEFAELLAFLEEAALDRVGCFAYSPVDGAVANALPDPVPPPIKEERRARLMALQANISSRRLQQKIGRTLPLLIDRIEDGAALGRSTADAPEIDGVVRIEKGARLAPGTFLSARITGANDHDLTALPA